MAQKTNRKHRSKPAPKFAIGGDPPINSDAGRRLLKDPSVIITCTECAWRLHPTEQRRFVDWKTNFGKAGSLNVVCRRCAAEHKDG